MRDKKNTSGSKAALGVILLALIVIGDIVAGIVGMASPQMGATEIPHWTLIGTFAGGFALIFNSTFSGITGLGTNITIPANLPHHTFGGQLPVIGGITLTQALFVLQGWVTIGFGSPNNTSTVTAVITAETNQCGIPQAGKTLTGPFVPGQGGTNQFCTSPFGQVEPVTPSPVLVADKGPTNPSRNPTGSFCAGFRCFDRLTVPVDGVFGVGCFSGSGCFDIGSTVYIYLKLTCGTFFTGSGIQSANSCHFWGTGSNGFDLGNLTITQSFFSIYA